MSLIDTNLLIYATVPGFAEHQAARDRENGIDRILTRDSSFRRIAFLDVVDPLA